MNTVKEYKNFLPKEIFVGLKNLICDKNFPWRIKSQMTDTDKNIYFSYSFYRDNNITSDVYCTHILPLLKNMECNAVVQIRANLFLSKLFEKSGWHIDYTFDCKTAILYLNTCNGGTEFKIDDKVEFVKAEENKLILFSSNVYHRACTSTDSEKRYIINFNYF